MLFRYFGKVCVIVLSIQEWRLWWYIFHYPWVLNTVAVVTLTLTFHALPTFKRARATWPIDYCSISFLPQLISPPPDDTQRTQRAYINTLSPPTTYPFLLRLVIHVTHINWTTFAQKITRSKGEIKFWTHDVRMQYVGQQMAHNAMYSFANWSAPYFQLVVFS